MELFLVEAVGDPLDVEVALAEAETEDTGNDVVLEIDEAVVKVDEDDGDNEDESADDDETSEDDAVLELVVDVGVCEDVLMEVVEVARMEDDDGLLEPDVLDVTVVLRDELMPVAPVVDNGDKSEEAEGVLDWVLADDEAELADCAWLDI